MDFLTSLNVEDLPEQQTRMLHLLDAHPNFNLNLGFDACCTCGRSIAVVKVSCPSCERVSYCSEECREQDSQVTNSVTSEEETALGHTAVICSLLSLCNDDEAVEEGQVLSNPTKREATTNRIRSEYESYPATLANVIVEGPCYQDILAKCKCVRKLLVHIIGASTDAELSTGPTESSSGDHNVVCDHYADALAELADKNGLDLIELVFVGPECPSKSWDESRIMRSLDKPVGNLLVKTVKGIYTNETAQSSPDIVVLFNPGFTVPDYQHWKETLKSIPVGTPFLSTTNTEMEGIADCQFLLDQDKIQSLPAGLADIFGVHSDGITSTSFFSVNPFSGTRVRQNGTMANDVFVKNRWMIGGVIASFDPTSNESGSAKKQKRGTNKKSSNPALI